MRRLFPPVPRSWSLRGTLLLAGVFLGLSEPATAQLLIPGAALIGEAVGCSRAVMAYTSRTEFLLSPDTEVMQFCPREGPPALALAWSRLGSSPASRLGPLAWMTGWLQDGRLVGLVRDAALGSTDLDVRLSSAEILGAYQRGQRRFRITRTHLHDLPADQYFEWENGVLYREGPIPVDPAEAREAFRQVLQSLYQDRADLAVRKVGWRLLREYGFGSFPDPAERMASEAREAEAEALCRRAAREVTGEPWRFPVSSSRGMRLVECGEIGVQALVDAWRRPPTGWPDLVYLETVSRHLLDERLLEAVHRAAVAGYHPQAVRFAAAAVLLFWMEPRSQVNIHPIYPGAYRDHARRGLASAVQIFRPSTVLVPNPGPRPPDAEAVARAAHDVIVTFLSEHNDLAILHAGWQLLADHPALDQRLLDLSDLIPSLDGTVPCRVASALAVPPPGGPLPDSLDRLGQCRRTGPAVVATLWRRPLEGSDQALKELVRVTRELQDLSVLDAVREAALSPVRTRAVRFAALEALHALQAGTPDRYIEIHRTDDPTLTPEAYIRTNYVVRPAPPTAPEAGPALLEARAVYETILLAFYNDLRDPVSRKVGYQLLVLAGKGPNVRPR